MVKYDLNKGLYPYPLKYLPSDGGTVSEVFVAGDPTVQPASNNWYVFCMTPEQLQGFRNIINVGAPIVYQDTYQEWWQRWAQLEQFPNEIPENSCMDLCQLILDCINSTPEIQQAIAAYAGTFQPSTDQGEQQEILDTDFVQGQAPCDNDNLFGLTTGLTDLLNQMAEDLLEILVNAPAALGRVGDIIEAIPVVGLLPFDDILQFSEKLATQVNDAYQAAYDTQIRDDFRCDLFCIAQDTCTLTIEQARDYFKDKITATVSDTDFLTIVNDILANNWLGEQSIYMMNWLILDTIIFGGEFLGIDHNRIATQIAALFNDPDSDWQILCTQCVDWVWDSDFANSQNIWVPTTDSYGDNADWTFGIGWESVDKQVSATQFMRQQQIETPEFTPTTITELELDYDLTKGLINNNVTSIVAVQVVKDDDTWEVVFLTRDEAVNGTGQTIGWTGLITDAKRLRVWVRSSIRDIAVWDGTAQINSVHVEGQGFNPFI